MNKSSEPNKMEETQWVTLPKQTTRESLRVKGVQRCSSCTKYNGGCSWTKVSEQGTVQFVPVEGWDATFLRSKSCGKIIETFTIHKCPEYVREKKRSVPNDLYPMFTPVWSEALEIFRVGGSVGKVMSVLDVTQEVASKFLISFARDGLL